MGNIFVLSSIDRPIRSSSNLKVSADRADLTKSALDPQAAQAQLVSPTRIMGVLNVTPDSFSDGGLYLQPEQAVDYAKRLFSYGAEIVDVGGESTRPGAPAVSVAEELRRVLPVIQAVHAEGLGEISIDTSKAEVAQAAVEAGASLINDISGGTFDPRMYEVMSKAEVPVVLMHTRARPEVMQQGELSYEGGVVEAVKRALLAHVERAVAAGVQEARIILDPGIGFGKTLAQNLLLLRDLREIVALGFPVLIGTSRKSFIGKLTGKDAQDRAWGTAGSVAVAIANGARIVRVHDVEIMRDVVLVADAIARAGEIEEKSG